MSSQFRLSYGFLCYTSFICFSVLIKPITTSSSVSSSNETDRQALLAIKFQIQGDPLQFLTSWNDSSHVCSWRGVRCNSMDQRVTALNLSSLEIGGALSTSVECGMGGPTSTLVDVYSYGILLLETFTGKRPTDSMFKDDFCLHNYVKIALPDQVMRIADPKLSSECQNELGMMANQAQTKSRGTCRFEKWLASVLHIGVKCSAQSPRGRMDIAAALMELQAARDGFLNADEKANKDD